MKESVISAKDLLPETFNDGSDEEDQYSVDSEGVENREDVVDDLEYDVYNLLACNYHAVRVLDNEDKEEVLKSQFTRSAQLLMKK